MHGPARGSSKVLLSKERTTTAQQAKVSLARCIKSAHAHKNSGVYKLCFLTRPKHPVKVHVWAGISKQASAYLKASMSA